ncbi:MAG: response regulator transcription factor [Saprospiraceae bacterium]|nr:response regulator transcription factor [Saprospiraceae bacterium]
MTSDTRDTKILVIDDELDVTDVISYNLLKEGYQVKTANSGSTGLEVASEFQPNLILLDVMMTDMDGMEVCRQLREQDKFDNTLIAFLTARGEDYTQIAAFDYGGDDFIVKPIRPSVLKSRISALLRRAGRYSNRDQNNTITLGEMTLNAEKFEVEVSGKKIDLAKKEFKILALLLSYPGRVFTRDEIYRQVWGSDIIVGERTIDVHIRRIREKIGDGYIRTLKGVGYKIDA